MQNSRGPEAQEVPLESKIDEIFGGTNRPIWILRFVLLILVVSIAVDAFVYGIGDTHVGRRFWTGSLVALVGLALCVLIIWLDLRSKNKDITTISAIGFGLMAGLAVSSLFWVSLEPVLKVYLAVGGAEQEKIQQAVQLLITVLICYLSVSLLLQTKGEFRFIIPYVEFQKQLKGSKPLVLDTSVIIDGLIADICETGIIDTKLIVPRFVLQELQGIADSSDKIRRNRGRRGLDVRSEERRV